MNDDISLKVLEEEQERRRQEGISVPQQSIVDRYLGGFLKNVEAAGAGIYGSVANPISAVQGLVSDSTPISQQMGVAEENYPENTTAYRFTEGAFPGTVGGFFAGGPVGAVAGGLVGGLTNVGAKQIFPESPLGQAAISFLPGFGGATMRGFRARVPETPTAGVDPETGVLLSPGQRGGDIGQLIGEQRLRTDARTAAIVSNFDKAQQAQIDDFTKSIQNIRNNLSPEAVQKVIGERYDEFNKSIINTFKQRNSQAFRQAKAVTGDIIPTNNVKSTIDNLIEQYNNPEVPGNTQILNSLKRIRENLTSMSGRMIIGPNGQPMVGTQADNISVERLQQNLAAWADTAYSGKYNLNGVTAFTDDAVSPGVSKGIARSVLNAFRRDLDEAAKSNIQGAELLKDARDQYAKGLEFIEKVAEKPVNKYVTSNAFKKAPEKIVEDIIKLRPSERAELAAVMGRDYPAVYDTVRSKAFTDILDKYRSAEGLDLRALFKDQPFGKDNAWLFANKAEQNKVSSLVQALEQINRKTKATDLSAEELRAAYRAASESAGVVGGAFAKYGVQAVVDTFRALAFQGSNDPKKIAYMFFTPNGRQLIQELAKPNPSPRFLTREALDGLMVGSATTAPLARDTAKPTEETVDIPLEQLLKAARNRGMIQ